MKEGGEAMSVIEGGVSRHDYRAIDNHFAELSRRAASRTSWLRAAAFWSYARSLSLLIVAISVAVCLVLLGCSFLLRKADLAKPRPVASVEKLSVQPVAPVQPAPAVKGGAIDSSGPDSGLPADEPRLGAETDPPEPEDLAGAADPSVPMVYDFTKFTPRPSNVLGLGDVVTGKGFESSTSTVPVGQWCYFEKGKPPVSTRIDLAHVSDDRIVESRLSKSQRAELGLTLTEFQRLRGLCHFSGSTPRAWTRIIVFMTSHRSIFDRVSTLSS
jgi:hypothetical protein